MLEVIGVTASGVMAALLAAPAADVAKHLGCQNFLYKSLILVQDHVWIGVPLAMVGVTIFESLRRSAGHPKVWQVVHEELDDFHDRVFSQTEIDDQHHHRVTLFRKVEWVFCRRRWPWSGWLKPVERSGHTSRKTSSIFKAPEAGDGCEGVAGKTWSRKKPVYVTGLPDIVADESMIAEYARKTWTPEWWVRKRMPTARSFYGIPLEVDNVVWGVVIIDSVHQGMDYQRIKRRYKDTARNLSRQLKLLRGRKP